MKRPWAARIPLAAIERAASLRLNAGIQAFQGDEVLWLCGDELDDKLDQQLRSLPGAVRFRRNEAQLTLWDALVPSERLPEGDWTPLAKLLVPAFPAAKFPASTPQSVPLALVRCEIVCEPNLLLTAISAWTSFAIGSPSVRLRPLTFAASADGNVLIHGRPLPPIDGTRIVERDGLAWPAGYAWTPEVDAATLRQRLLPESDDLALFRPDGSWERIPKRSFVRATRSAVRETAEALKRTADCDSTSPWPDGLL